MRSLMFLPGNRARFLEKAATLDADGFIVDLEDSVPDAEKAAARNALAAHVPTMQTKPVWVRPNAADTPYFRDDLAAIGAVSGVVGILLPKTESVAALRDLDAAIAAQEAGSGRPSGSLKLILSIETARGVMRAFDLATALPRIETLCFGGARDGDLMTDLGCDWSNERGTLQHAREQVLIAARAAGCRVPLDGVFTDVRDLAGFEQDTLLSRALGYRGRTLIHPSQIEPANRLYRPSREDLARSRRLVEAFDAAVARGQASVLFEGSMIDVAMAKAARNVIAWAQARGVEE